MTILRGRISALLLIICSRVLSAVANHSNHLIVVWRVHLRFCQLSVGFGLGTSVWSFGFGPGRSTSFWDGNATSDGFGPVT